MSEPIVVPEEIPMAHRHVCQRTGKTWLRLSDDEYRAIMLADRAAPPPVPGETRERLAALHEEWKAKMRAWIGHEGLQRDRPDYPGTMLDYLLSHGVTLASRPAVPAPDEPVFTSCPTCNTTLLGNGRFCASCGHDFAPEPKKDEVMPSETHRRVQLAREQVGATADPEGRDSVNNAPAPRTPSAEAVEAAIQADGCPRFSADDHKDLTCLDCHRLILAAAYAVDFPAPTPGEKT